MVVGSMCFVRCRIPLGDQIVDFAPDKSVARLSEHTLGLLVGEPDYSSLIDFEDRVGRGFNQLTKRCIHI